MFGQNICIEIEDNNITEGHDTTFNDDYSYEACSIENSNAGLDLGMEMEIDTDNIVAKQLDYHENYIVSDLKKIADYYEIPTRKLKKDELIQEIVLYEMNPENSIIYLKRLQAWYWMKELKKDPKLKQFILF